MSRQSTPMRLCAIGLCSLSLASCASLPASNASSASDLQVLRLGMQALTQPRSPHGDIKRREDARNNGELWQYAGDMEDALWLSEQDKQRAAAFVLEATQVIEESRKPPRRWWESLFKPR